MTSCLSHRATASASASTPSSALSEADSSSWGAGVTSRSSTPWVWAPVLRSGSASRGSYRGWRPGRSRINWLKTWLTAARIVPWLRKFLVRVSGRPSWSSTIWRTRWDASISARQRVRQMVEDQDGLPLTLTRNFRSHGTILAAVNQVFDRLIRERPGLQPRYDPLEADPDRKTGAQTQGVELRLVTPAPHDEESASLSAEEGVEAEAEAIARWLKHEVIGQEVLIERDGRRRPVEPGDVALLFRTFLQSWEYLGALRRHGLPYVAEGERHFYQRQEVIDLVNLVCCVQNPHDQVALLGLLRCAVGALTDREIMDVVALRPLDYRGTGPSGLDSHPKAGHLRRLYAALASLQRDCPLRPLPDALDLIFERLPLLELAAASLHGEQAVANLWKVRALADGLVDQPGMTLAGFVELLKARLADPPDESESGLAEEASREAVRIMSVHKAKGLEFPIVILVGLHAGTKPPYEPIQVQQDWSTGVLGLRLGDRCTLGGVYAAEKLGARLEAERRRVLYVGMTRAKERLVLSGALTRRQSPGSFLALLKEEVGVGGAPRVPVAPPDATGDGPPPTLADDLIT